MTLPAKPKSNLPKKKILIGSGLCSLAVIVAVIIFLAFPSPTTYNDRKTESVVIQLWLILQKNNKVFLS